MPLGSSISSVKENYPMYRKRFLLAVLLVASIASVVVVTSHHGVTAQSASAAAAPGGQKVKPTPAPVYNVSSTIYDFDSLNNSLQLQSDDLNVNLTGTGQPYGIYQTDSSSNVISRLDGQGECSTECTWDIFTDSSTSRSIKLTLSRLSGSGPTGTYSLHAHVHSHCFDPTGATTNPQNWFNITTSEPNCSMKVVFTIGRTNYFLVMSPLYDSPQPTGRATVTCTQVSGNSCFAWSVVANLTQSAINPNPTVANLYSANRNGTYNFVGQYTLTYGANVTYP